MEPITKGTPPVYSDQSIQQFLLKDHKLFCEVWLLVWSRVHDVIIVIDDVMMW